MTRSRKERKTKHKIEQHQHQNEKKRNKLQPLNESQAEFLRLVKENDIVLAHGSAGCGKAQPIDCVVLSENGWKQIKDLNIGDKIITPKGELSEITNIFPQGKQKIYKITFEDRCYTFCTAEHLWRIQNYAWDKVVDTNTIINLLKNSKTFSKRIYVPLVENIDFKQNKELPIHPYLLGVLIGDGGLTNTVTFTTADNEIINSIKSILNTNFSHLSINKKNTGKYSYAIVSNSRKNKNTLLQIIRELNLNVLSHLRFIPQEYLNSSLENRLNIICGLMDTDGTVGQNGDVQYCTTSKQLALDMQYLIRSIGGLCKISTKQPYFTYKGEYKKGKLAYILSIRYKNAKQLFTLKRKQDRINENYQYKNCLRRRIVDIQEHGYAECACISIKDENKLYITNDFIVTHNTFISIGYAIEAIMAGHFERIIITRPVVEAGEKLGFLPGNANEKLKPYLDPLYDSMKHFLSFQEIKTWENQDKISVAPIAYMRGRTFDKSIIIVDEAQNCTMQQLKLIITRIGKDSKMIISGDITQSDLGGCHNDFDIFMDKLYNIDDRIAVFEFAPQDIVRHRLIGIILEALNDKQCQ